MLYDRTMGTHNSQKLKSSYLKTTNAKLDRDCWLTSRDQGYMVQTRLHNDGYVEDIRWDNTLPPGQQFVITVYKRDSPTRVFIASGSYTQARQSALAQARAHYAAAPTVAQQLANTSVLPS